jgi:hypothetical protein
MQTYAKFPLKRAPFMQNSHYCTLKIGKLVWILKIFFNVTATFDYIENWVAIFREKNYSSEHEEHTDI